MNKKLIKCISMLLLVLLLCGCGTGDSFGMTNKAEAGERFEDIAYVRPELESMEQAVEELEQALKRLSLPTTLGKLVEQCYDCYYNFDTMYNLADIRSCQNTADEYYAGEYAWCLEKRPRMQQLMEQVYSMCATSRYAPLLEYLYFWEGFTEQYSGDDAMVYPDGLYELFRLENRLLAEYRAAVAEPYIELDGQNVSYEEFISTADDGQYNRALSAYYEQYNGPLGDIYVRLVKLRREQAELMGFDSYEQMQYLTVYERDYTPEQAAEYLADIRDNIAPFYAGVMAGEPYSRISWDYLPEERLYSILARAAESMGGDIAECFEYMDSRGLYDIGLRPFKANISFQTYLADYEAPFLFLDPYGDKTDVLSYAHEFGHFTDAWLNFNAYETTDVAECFSQAMEYLLLFHLEGAVTEAERQELVLCKALDTLELYVWQAALAEFESRAFTLPEEELTVEGLNSLYLEVSGEYGLSDGGEAAQALGWIDVSHLFETPFYMVSYPVTNDIAMQIFALEQQERGAGLEKYIEMLPREYESFQPTIEAAGLESPFAPGRTEQVLQSLRTMLE